MNLNIGLKSLKSFLHPYSARDWRIIVIVTSFVVVCGAGWGGYTFWAIQSGSLVVAGADKPVPPVSISREALQKGIDAYQARATNFEAKNFPAYTINDPHKNLKVK